MEERYLLGFALRTDHNSWYIPVNHKPYLDQQPDNFIVPEDLFAGYEGPIIAHNMKFDYIVLKRHGIELPVGNLWCTMMLSVYIDENKTTGHDLDAVLERFLGARKKTVEAAALKKFGWVTAPAHYMAQYAEQDCSVSQNCMMLYLTNQPVTAHTILGTVRSAVYATFGRN